MRRAIMRHTSRPHEGLRSGINWRWRDAGNRLATRPHARSSLPARHRMAAGTPRAIAAAPPNREPQPAEAVGRRAALDDERMLLAQAPPPRHAAEGHVTARHDVAPSAERDTARPSRALCPRTRRVWPAGPRARRRCRAPRCAPAPAPPPQAGARAADGPARVLDVGAHRSAASSTSARRSRPPPHLAVKNSTTSPTRSIVRMSRFGGRGTGTRRPRLRRRCAWSSLSA